MDHIIGADRNQLQFLSLDQMLPEDSWARIIDLFVDILPLEGLGFKHASVGKEGRPAYNPSTLLKLYLYGYVKEEGHYNSEYIKKYHLLEVAEEWRQFLLNGVYPMNYNKIYFFPLYNNVKYNLEYADCYLDRMFDSSFVWDNDGVRSSFFCKLPRYAFWATITESNTPTNYGISINPIKGIIDFQEEFTRDKITSNYGITQFYQGRISLTNQLIKDSEISKSQQEKIEQRMRSNKNFPDSELEQLLKF